MKMRMKKTKKVHKTLIIYLCNTVAFPILSGSRCMICTATKSPSNLNVPLIYIGKYRTLKVCKKTHLADDNVRMRQIIANELAYISEHGDEPLNILVDGSDDETTAPEAEETRYTIFYFFFIKILVKIWYEKLAVDWKIWKRILNVKRSWKTHCYILMLVHKSANIFVVKLQTIKAVISKTKLIFW